MSDDYGPYGRGLDGYVHYMQTVNESKKGGGGGGNKPSGSGCLGAVIMAFILIGGVLLFVATVLI